MPFGEMLEGDLRVQYVRLGVLELNTHCLPGVKRHLASCLICGAHPVIFSSSNTVKESFYQTKLEIDDKVRPKLKMSLLLSLS
jgi:hypothetical protein